MQVKKVKREEIEALLRKNYGSTFSLKQFEAFVNKDGKIYLFAKGLASHMIKESMYGLHFGTLKRNEKIQLTIEGAQMVGPTANKNIAILDEENAHRFMEGLPALAEHVVECEINNFVLVKFGDYFLGSGVMRASCIESTIPKERRIAKILKK